MFRIGNKELHADNSLVVAMLHVGAGSRVEVLDAPEVTDED